MLNTGMVVRLWVALGLILGLVALARADAMVVQTCGTLPQAYAAGGTRLETIDVNGVRCVSGPAGVWLGPARRLSGRRNADHRQCYGNHGRSSWHLGRGGRQVHLRMRASYRRHGGGRDWSDHIGRDCWYVNGVSGDRRRRGVDPISDVCAILHSVECCEYGHHTDHDGGWYSNSR